MDGLFKWTILLNFLCLIILSSFKAYSRARVEIRPIEGHQIPFYANHHRTRVDDMGYLRCERLARPGEVLDDGQRMNISGIVTTVRKLSQGDCLGNLFEEFMLPIAKKMDEKSILHLCEEESSTIKGFILACGTQHLRRERNNPNHISNAALVLEQLYHLYQVYLRRLSRIDPWTYRKGADGEVIREKNLTWENAWNLFEQRFNEYLELPHVKRAIKAIENKSEVEGRDFSESKAAELVDLITSSIGEFKELSEIVHLESSHLIPVMLQEEEEASRRTQSISLEDLAPPIRRESIDQFSVQLNDTPTAATLTSPIILDRTRRSTATKDEGAFYDDRGPLLPSMVNIVSAYVYLQGIESGEADAYFRQSSRELNKKGVAFSIDELKEIKRDEIYAQFPELSSEFYENTSRSKEESRRLREELFGQLEEISSNLNSFSLRMALRSARLDEVQSDFSSIAENLIKGDLSTPPGNEVKRREVLVKLMGLQNAFSQAQRLGFDHIDQQVRNPDYQQLQKYQALLDGSQDFFFSDRDTARNLLRACDKYYQEKFWGGVKTGSILVGTGIAVGTGFGALAAGVAGGTVAASTLLGISLGSGISTSVAHLKRAQGHHNFLSEKFKNELEHHSQVEDARSLFNEARVYMALDVIGSSVGAAGGTVRLFSQSKGAGMAFRSLAGASHATELSIAGANIYYENWAGLALQAGFRGVGLAARDGHSQRELARAYKINDSSSPMRGIRDLAMRRYLLRQEPQEHFEIPFTFADRLKSQPTGGLDPFPNMDPVSLQLFELAQEYPQIRLHLAGLFERAKLNGRTRFKISKEDARRLRGEEGAISSYEATAIALDSLTELTNTRMRVFNIYTHRRSRFIDDNVEAINDILSVQLLLRRTPDAIGGRQNHQVRGPVKKAFAGMLPWQLKKAGVRFNRRHLEIFNDYGADALYQYLYHTQGSATALKYWLVHVGNIQTVGIIALAAITVPEVLKALDEWNEALYTNLDQEGREILDDLLPRQQESPIDLGNDIKERLEQKEREGELSSDAEILLEYLRTYLPSSD